MSDRYRDDDRDDRRDDDRRDDDERHPPLPWWLVRRLLRDEEPVTWVCGPRFNPPWERYITHPGLFLIALGLIVLCVAMGRIVAGSWMQFPVACVLISFALFLGSIIVLALANAYFTRLVVTSDRLLIVQGYEVCKSWLIDDLPPSLVRYGRRGHDDDRRTVDLDALKTMMGNSASGQFAEAKSILALGKQLDRIKTRRIDRG
jgi:hypothetical protein